MSGRNKHKNPHNLLSDSVSFYSILYLSVIIEFAVVSKSHAVSISLYGRTLHSQFLGFTLLNYFFLIFFQFLYTCVCNIIMWQDSHTSVEFILFYLNLYLEFGIYFKKIYIDIFSFLNIQYLTLILCFVSSYYLYEFLRVCYLSVCAIDW